MTKDKYLVCRLYKSRLIRKIFLKSITQVTAYLKKSVKNDLKGVEYRIRKLK